MGQRSRVRVRVRPSPGPHPETEGNPAKPQTLIKSAAEALIPHQKLHDRCDDALLGEGSRPRRDGQTSLLHQP